MQKSYKDIMSSQSDIRLKVVSIMEKEQLSIDAMAKLIGISPVTLNRFLVEEAALRFVVFCKVKTFCESV
jgi:predicted transcriptional regulator